MQAKTNAETVHTPAGVRLKTSARSRSVTPAHATRRAPRHRHAGAQPTHHKKRPSLHRQPATHAPSGNSTLTNSYTLVPHTHTQMQGRGNKAGA